MVVEAKPRQLSVSLVWSNNDFDLHFLEVPDELVRHGRRHVDSALKALDSERPVPRLEHEKALLEVGLTAPFAAALRSVL
eukprot:CAMPEP_0114175380 /NCGR_PEP_ID=MMETSP0043_2-20121206/36933_1 /TAXON_ID=464988 /ORGANISM="Hemiselmis andersenii, Strain CCMP644" /LENGTH=79 /DNA_ID=CAMNT_0001273629 /DNA_START=420 /DNA_END=659 /DNA_ORIENTATION=-